jgi:predicted SPOUT superfamily RNA methylase MTH1
MFPYPRSKELNVALFPSTFRVDRSLVELTLKVSFIVRILTTARVSNLFWVISSKEDKNILNKINKIIKYSLTPPYLKKYIKYDRDLSKVGLLQPVNTPYHIVHEEPIEGEVRIGKLLGKNKVDVGFKKLIESNGKYFLVIDSLNYKLIKYINIYYNGFKIKNIKLNKIKKINNIIIGSRNGKNPFQEAEKIKNIYESMGLTLLIGPPDKGCIELLGYEYLDKAYNFFPMQGSKDIRAEEALAFSLSIINYIIY